MNGPFTWDDVGSKLVMVGEGVAIGDASRLGAVPWGENIKGSDVLGGEEEILGSGSLAVLSLSPATVLINGTGSGILLF